MSVLNLYNLHKRRRVGDLKDGWHVVFDSNFLIHMYRHKACIIFGEPTQKVIKKCHLILEHVMMLLRAVK